MTLSVGSSDRAALTIKTWIWDLALVNPNLTGSYTVESGRFSSGSIRFTVMQQNGARTTSIVSECRQVLLMLYRFGVWILVLDGTPGAGLRL